MNLSVFRPPAMAGATAGLAGACSRMARSPWMGRGATLFILVALIAGAAMASPDFLTAPNAANVARQVVGVGIMSMGMLLVVLTGGIDLSVGSVLALTTMVAAWLLQVAHWPAEAVIAIVLLGGAAFGALQGAVIHVFKLQAFIVTLAGMFLARGLCFLISVDSITIDAPLFVTLSQTQLPLFGGAFLSPGAVIALAVLGAGLFVAHCTAFGRTVYALGGSEGSALMMGLAVGRTKVAVYALSGFCASLAGLLFAFYMLSGYGQHAQGVELDAIAAVVIGGTVLTGGYGYVAGALSGVLVLGLIQTLIAFDGTLSSWWTRIVIGALLFVFCAVQRLLSLKKAAA